MNSDFLLSRIVRALLLFLFLGHTMLSVSQQYNFKDYIDNLPQPYVYTITQDIKGYLWIGTGNGLARYNGFQFENFTPKDSLADNFITCSYHNGDEIFFGHMNGMVTRFNGTYFFPVAGETVGSGISDIEKSRDNEIWCSSFSSGLTRLDSKMNRLIVRDQEMKLTIISFKFLPDNKLLVGTMNGLAYCSISNSGETGVIRYLTEIPEDKIADIISLRNDSGYIVVTENKGIFHVKKEKEGFEIIQVGKKLNLEPTGVQGILEDRNSNLWISTFGHGIIKLAYSASGKFSEVIYLNKSTGFSTDFVKTVFEDREGIIWSGNYGSGLTKITQKAHSFISIEKHFGTVVSSLFITDNSRWLGTDKGLLKINHTTGKMSEFYTYLQGLPGDKITALYSSGDNKMWIGTEKNGVYLMQISNEEFSPVTIGKGLLENSITSITGKGDQVWIGTKKGVCNINLTTNEKRWYTLEKGGLPHNFVNHIYIDRKNRVWISTPGNSIVYILNGIVNKIHIISEKRIVSLGQFAEDNDSSIWVISNGSGIFRIGLDSILNITTQNGLISDYCYSLLADKNEFMWVGHRGGISRIRTSDLTIKPLQENAGIGKNFEAIKNAVFEDNNNKVWVGFNEGLWNYDPEKGNRALLPPVLNIISIKVNDEDVAVTERLVLPPGRYKIQIGFLGIDLTEPELVNYQFQLEGYDQTAERTSSTSVTYRQLNEGKYSFELKATSSEGITNENPLILQILIKKPLWKNWWFYLIVLIVILFSVILYNKRRNYLYLMEKRKLESKIRRSTFELARKNSLLKQQQGEIIDKNKELEKYRNYLEDLVKERTQELLNAKNKAEESDRLKTSFLNNISHEIRTPLNAICGFSGLLVNESLTMEEKEGFHKIINNSTESLLFMIDEIMDISLLESSQIIFSNEKFNINEVLADLEKHCQDSNSKNIEIEFVNKKSGTSIEILCDKKRFHQVFTNLLNNAMKFTDSGKISFGYEVLDKSVQFFVSDTGIGIEEVEREKIFIPFYKVEDKSVRLFRGVGIGLALCKKIVELMGGKIWVNSTINKGSVFYFTLPVTNLSSKSEKTTFRKDLLKGMTLLVAEDNSLNYELVEKMLQPYGPEIKCAVNGQEAIDFINNNPTIENCVILMDLKMPKVDGYEAKRQIRIINPDIPIIAFTAYALTDDRKRITKEKFDDYIVKPVKKENLLSILSKYIKVKD